MEKHFLKKGRNCKLAKQGWSIKFFQIYWRIKAKRTPSHSLSKHSYWKAHAFIPCTILARQNILFAAVSDALGRMLRIIVLLKQGRRWVPESFCVLSSNCAIPESLLIRWRLRERQGEEAIQLLREDVEPSSTFWMLGQLCAGGVMPSNSLSWFWISLF